MQTGGHGNDGLITLVPIGVFVVVGVMFFGGPVEALQAVNALLGETVRVTMQVVGALFS